MKKAILAAIGPLALAVAAATAIWTAAPSAASPGTPLAADEAFALEVSRGDAGSIVVSWDIASGYYLYRDQIAARAADGAQLSIVTAPGIRKDDPTFGQTEIYLERAEAVIADPGGGEIELVYQGCQDGGICYAPQTRRIDVSTLAITDPAARPGPGRAFGLSPGLSSPAASPDVTWNMAPDAADEAPRQDTTAPAGFALADDPGLVQSLLGDGGTLMVLAMFPLFGLLLAFTPCVFPMYPILAAALGREGEGLTARRGFTLSAVYVAGLASAFAILGAIAGWSGRNLQLALQSPVTVGVLAALFVVLALPMFGLFRLQLPARWTNWVATRTGGPNGSTRGSKRAAAALGFSSALIVGPCVTAPLAGALLYIAQTADVALGAAALFGLAVGKGIPLIVLGTLGGRVMPRAGAWMESVNRVFGFGFLATAIWMATPLLPVGLDLALWAILLIAAASFAFTARFASGPALAATRAAGAVASIYGAILMVGAASGATDPLKPLAPLAQRGATTPAAQPLDFATVLSADDLRVRLASADGKPTMVYFTADWCVTCFTIERSVLPDDAVRRGLSGFQLVKADLTDVNATNTALMEQLNVAGPPTMVFFDARAQEVPGTRLVGDVTVALLTRSAERLGEAGR